MNTKYGLICNSKILKEEDPSKAFVGLTRKDFGGIASEQGDEKALEKLKNDVLSNLELTVDIINHCRNIGIDHYRLNTAIFGIVADPGFDIDFKDLPSNNDLIEAIKNIGRTYPRGRAHDRLVRGRKRGARASREGWNDRKYVPDRPQGKAWKRSGT